MESLTAEIALPGLEKAVSETVRGNWIERPGGKRLMVFSGRSHPDLAQSIAEHLGVHLGGVALETFKNGETYCRYEESIRGADVFIVQTGCIPVDRHLMELMFMLQAAKLASAKRITAVIPMSRKCREKSGSAVMWSTGMLKKPWICPACRSIVSTRSAPASCSMSATRRAEIGSRGFAFRSWRAYG